MLSTCRVIITSSLYEYNRPARPPGRGTSNIVGRHHVRQTSVGTVRLSHGRPPARRPPRSPIVTGTEPSGAFVQRRACVAGQSREDPTRLAWLGCRRAHPLGRRCTEDGATEPWTEFMATRAKELADERARLNRRPSLAASLSGRAGAQVHPQ